eukprot:824421-Ditylum_brightwellii.AAC.1
MGVVHFGIFAWRSLMGKSGYQCIYARSVLLQRMCLQKKRYCRAKGVVDCNILPWRSLMGKSEHLYKNLGFPKDTSFKEEIFQSKNGGGLLYISLEKFDGEVRALWHIWKKPSFQKDMSSNEEILQSKGGDGLLHISLEMCYKLVGALTCLQ